MLEYLTKLMQGDDAFTLEIRCHNHDEHYGAVVVADVSGLVLKTCDDSEAKPPRYTEVLLPWTAVSSANVVY